MRKSLFYNGLFVLMVAAQLFVPAQMIIRKEKTLTLGTEFRFRTAPLDPADPFSGRFVALSFSDAMYFHDDTMQIPYRGPVYVVVKQDSLGFAIIDTLLMEKPADGTPFFAASVAYRVEIDDSVTYRFTTRVRFPFDRFYMKETKAPEAEKVFLEAMRDSTKTTSAVVRLFEGDFVLEDVRIGEVSLKDLTGDQ